jgi:hypothetical protein
MDILGVDGALIAMGGLTAAYLCYQVAKKRSAPPVRRFTGPFSPQLQADITHDNGSALEPGHYVAVLVIGSDGFSARFRVVPGQPAAVQFLAPKAALPRFTAGTEFSVAQGKEIVGKGKVH